MLPQLVEYERREAAEDLPEQQLPAGYSRRQIVGLIDLDDRGSLISFVTLATKEGRRRLGKEVPVPDRIRTSDSDFKPLLLADNAEFVLGVTPAKQGKQSRTGGRHQRFVTLVRECADATKEPGVAAALHFLEAGSWREIPLPDSFAAGDLITFRVNGEYLIELPSVRRFWADYLSREREMEAGQRAKRAGRRKEKAPATTQSFNRSQCLVCGEKDQPIARLHEVKIKGIPGGQPSGTALVSFNAPAFESYGLTQSYNAPICQECAETYVKGLNRLLRGEDTSLRLEQVAYTFWAREPQGFNVAKLLGNPDPEQVRALLESPRKARPAAPVEASDFYALALSASRGRAVVRDWIESTLPEVQDNLADYFRRQRIVPLFGEEARFFSVQELVRSLTPDRQRRRSLESNEIPDAPATMMRSAVTGAPLPNWMLFLAVRRNRAEQGPLSRRQGRVLGWARAALIKLVLQSQTPELEPDEEGKMDTTTQQSPAYLCGRLLALLEQAQEQAVKPKATLVDRFYGSASSAPASVFGLLLRGAQAHLSKLRKDNPGAHNNIQRGLEEVLSQLGPELPRVLNLRDQAVFALGYYYQRAARWGRHATRSAAGPEQE